MHVRREEPSTALKIRERESDSPFFAASEEKEREGSRKRRVHCVGRNDEAKKKEKSRKRDHGET